MEKKNEDFQSYSLDDLISNRYADYAKYIIQERALPDARDGLKPVQRRILYAMYREGNTWDKGFRKSAKTVGIVIGNYHPHGDSSVYEAMVRLSQSWKQNYPLVEMHGNNGSIDDDPAAAMRYTEARLAAISEMMLADIDKNTVSWTPNFDDTENEPTVLPAKFPNLLVNGATGIASGYATNIPPHNLNEIIEGTIYRIKNPDCSLEDMMQIVKGPDFPTGGIVQGKEGIAEAFLTGRGKVVVRGKTSIEKTKTVQQIVITEIPFEVIKVNLVKKIDEIRFNKAIDGILDVRDESDRNGLRIVVDVHKDADANNILNYLFKNTDLQVNYNYNMVSIVDKRPMQLGLLDLLDSFIDFDGQVIKARSQYEFDKRMDRCHILEGLIKAVSVMDEVIAIIRSSKDKADAKNRLIERFEFTEKQAEAIVTLRLYRLTNTDIFELKEEFAKLVAEMKELDSIINNEDKLKEVMSNELLDVKKSFGRDRLTQIEDEVQEISINKASMVANEHIMITLSRDGYIKRVSMRSYNSSNDAPTGLKAEDQLIGYCEADTVDTLLAFSASGEYAAIPLYQLQEAKWKDIGQHISNYVKVNNAEKFISACLIKDFNTYAWIITASEKGMIKRTPVDLWQLQRTNRASTAMNLDQDDKMIAARVAYQGDEVALITAKGFALRYGIEQIPAVSAKAKGVKAVKLVDDKVVDLSIINKSNTEMIYINDKCGAKRIKITDIDVTNRATKGMLIAKKNKTNPTNVVCSVVCNLNDDIKLITYDGSLQLKGKDIPLMSKEARYSNPLTNRDWYCLRGITEVKLIDKPIEADDKKEYEKIQLEV